MFRWLARLFGLGFQPTQPAAAPPRLLQRVASFFTSDVERTHTRGQVLELAQARALQVTPANFAMDGPGGSVIDSAKMAFAMGDSSVPDAQLLWYSSQSFIGFQTCAIIAQQWLVDKACSVPARDAFRNGYEITVNDGTKLPPKVLDALRAADKRFGLRRQCVEFVKMSRVFGIRIALFQVDSPDPLYYERPFNPDGVLPGSYKGIVQVDPYWCVPELSLAGASNPASQGFYEPLHWTIQGKRYHKSHLVISRGPEVPDLLKPSYLYAGLSIPQRIYERVYAAERTANEAPQLALTKRAMVFYTDTGQALANQTQFENRLSLWAYFRDNFGVKVADKEGDKVEQHETSLGDLDTTIMTQYQIVAAVANVPATKLLGTAPKGFNSTGEYEEANYHEELESIQTNDGEPLVNRHHLLLMRSEIAPRFGIAPVETRIEWHPLDTPTAKEEAEVRKIDADTDAVLVTAGAVSGEEVRARLIADPKSGYTGLADAAPAAAPDEAAMTSLDASDFDPVAGTYAEAEIITNQRYINPEVVAQKIADGDFLVQLSPEFVTPAGKAYRVVIDGHHSLVAAVQSGNLPVFVQANYEDTDYRNAMTQLPMGGQEQEIEA